MFVWTVYTVLYVVLIFYQMRFQYSLTQLPDGYKAQISIRTPDVVIIVVVVVSTRASQEREKEAAANAVFYHRQEMIDDHPLLLEKYLVFEDV